MPLSKVVPTLFFSGQAKEAADHYVSIFPNSSIEQTAYYPNKSYEAHGQEEGSVVTVTFILDGVKMVALNGPPMFRFTEAISFAVQCEDQAEVDRYWDRLSQGGDEKKQMCCWLADKFGVSWQIVPRVYAEAISGPDRERAAKAMAIGMTWKKPDIDGLEKALAE